MDLLHKRLDISVKIVRIDFGAESFLECCQHFVQFLLVLCLFKLYKHKISQIKNLVLLKVSINSSAHINFAINFHCLYLIFNLKMSNWKLLPKNPQLVTVMTELWDTRGCRKWQNFHKLDIIMYHIKPKNGTIWRKMNFSSRISKTDAKIAWHLPCFISKRIISHAKSWFSQPKYSL